VANKFKNQNHAQPMRRCSVHRRYIRMFFFLEGGVRDASFFLFSFEKGIVSVFFSILGRGWFILCHDTPFFLL
jgi:hypothetical protein